jgi:cobalt-zinc-cadmium efflux system protein
MRNGPTLLTNQGDMPVGAEHSHAKPGAGNERNLWITLGLTATAMVAEVIGSFITGSLALLSDAAHMFTDVAALGISLAAI